MPFAFNTYEFSPPAQTSNFFAHLVTSRPSGTETQVAGLSLPSTVGYEPLLLSISTTVVGSSTTWNMPDVIWPAINWTDTLVGICVVVGSSATPGASDSPWLYFEFTNSFGAQISFRPGRYSIKFGTGGQPLHISEGAYKYDVGNFTGYPFYTDLVTAIVSNNNSRYTPCRPPVSNYFDSSTYNTVYDINLSCYWIGNTNHKFDLLDRHDVGYNDITFPTLGSPLFGFAKLATFNGTTSYITVGDTSVNGADFRATSGQSLNEYQFLMYFVPTLNNTEEILIDATTDNNSNGYVIRKTATNKIELMFIASGSPHNAASPTLVSTNNLTIGSGNLIFYSNYGSARGLWLNSTYQSAGIAANAMANIVNGIRLGARRGLKSAITGANFTGKIAYFVSGTGPIADRTAGMGAITNRDTSLIYNNKYYDGWSQTGLNAATEMLAANAFPPRRDIFVRSVGNLNSYAGANNLVGTTALSQLKIDLPDCFYINFGLNKAKPGTIAIPFHLSANNIASVKLDVASATATFCVWASDEIGTPTNSNLIDPSKWDEYEYQISGIDNSGTYSTISGLTLTTSGSYRFYLLDVSNIPKHYQHFRLGWKNAVVGTSGGGSQPAYAYYLFYNSSVLTAQENLVPLDTSYTA